ncbi:MAG: glycine cleavage system aminomethyltransferase GcvT [Parachlamydiaceae bacterium]|nr:glycine cleavage system aminomethyltransferase GcvT [Parachlamydiaceae bacterium]
MEQPKSDQMKTVLYDAHVALGAKMVEFGGWAMPLYYQSISSEHLAVRKAVGIFDVSHMGLVLVQGANAESFLDYLGTNAIVGKADFTATYTVLCHPDGGCVDDVIVYKRDPTHYFLVVNAANREKDLKHLQQYSKSFQVKVTDLYADWGILSIQGPRAEELICHFFPQAKEIGPMHFRLIKYENHEIILSHTGYTGAGGFEIYAPNEVILDFWSQFLDKGKAIGIVPVGLGARDTLRLEMGFALYGHELTDEIAPTESVAAWTVKKHNFVAKEVLDKLESSGNKRKQYGVVMQDPGIARAGYGVFQNGVQIGVVTSGTHSPSLNKAIAIVMVQEELEVGEEVAIEIRQKRCRAQVVALPFIEKSK